MLQSAVKLRPGEERACQFQYLVGSTQFLDLALQFLHSLRFSGRDALTHACIHLSALDPFVQRLRHTTSLGGYGLDGGPQRWIRLLLADSTRPAKSSL